MSNTPSHKCALEGAVNWFRFFCAEVLLPPPPLIVDSVLGLHGPVCDAEALRGRRHLMVPRGAILTLFQPPLQNNTTNTDCRGDSDTLDHGRAQSHTHTHAYTHTHTHARMGEMKKSSHGVFFFDIQVRYCLSIEL